MGYLGQGTACGLGSAHLGGSFAMEGTREVREEPGWPGLPLPLRG